MYQHINFIYTPPPKKKKQKHKQKKKEKKQKKNEKTKQKKIQTTIQKTRCPLLMPPKPFTKKYIISVLDLKHTKTINCKHVYK